VAAEKRISPTSRLTSADGFLIFHLAFPAGSFLKRNPALADGQFDQR
jgi:hypothetical protein